MRFIVGLVTLFGLFSIFYLFGSFVFVSFDLAKWSEEGRVVVAFFGGIISLGLAALAVSAWDEFK